MVGDLIERDKQYQLGELLMGSRTPFPIQVVHGLGLPNVDFNDLRRAARDGDIPGEDYMRHRLIVVEHGIYDDPPHPPFKDSVDTLALAMAPLRTGLKEFSFKLVGWPKMFCRVRPRRSSRPVNGLFHKGMSNSSLMELYAPEPRIFEAEESDHSFVLVASETSVQSVVSVGGTYTTMPIVEIEGPARNPRLRNVDDEERTLRIDIDIQSTETLVIDIDRRTVRLEGTNVYDAVRGDNEWWELLPGQNNTLLYERAGDALIGANSTVTLRWHNARHTL